MKPIKGVTRSWAPDRWRVSVRWGAEWRTKSVSLARNGGFLQSLTIANAACRAFHKELGKPIRRYIRTKPLASSGHLGVHCTESGWMLMVRGAGRPDVRRFVPRAKGLAYAIKLRARLHAAFHKNDPEPAAVHAARSVSRRALPTTSTITNTSKPTSVRRGVAAPAPTRATTITLSDGSTWSFAPCPSGLCWRCVVRGRLWGSPFATPVIPGNRMTAVDHRNIANVLAPPTANAHDRVVVLRGIIEMSAAQFASGTPKAAFESLASFRKALNELCRLATRAVPKRQ